MYFVVRLSKYGDSDPFADHGSSDTNADLPLTQWFQTEPEIA